jgi:nucleoside-diphosphate-sugar epimerase
MLEYDLRECIEVSKTRLLKMSDSNVLILGASGFVGTWLSNVLAFSNLELGTNIRLTLSSRNPNQILNPKYVNPHIVFQSIDLRNTSNAELETFDYGFHLATPSVPKTGGLDGDVVCSTSIAAAKLLVENAKRNGNQPSVLHASSGGIYNPSLIKHKIVEDDKNISEGTSEHNYKNAKIETEKLILDSTNKGEIKGTSPRLFTFLGPGISLNDHFAIGNFMKNQIEGGDIEVKGNPRTTRSYMYPTDLTNWILAAIVHPSLETTHIGSEEAISMEDLAEKISDKKNGVKYLNPESEESHYVPSTEKTRMRLGVSQLVSLEDGLTRWKKFLKLNS